MRCGMTGERTRQKDGSLTPPPNPQAEKKKPMPWHGLLRVLEAQ
jgi:hypothetical protein